MSEDRVLWLKDAGERLLWTFVQAFLSALVLAPAFDLSILRAAAIAGLAAVISYVKSTLAQLSPDTISPASVVPTLLGGNPPVLDGEDVEVVHVGINDAEGNLVAIVKGSRPQ